MPHIYFDETYNRLWGKQTFVFAVVSMKMNTSYYISIFKVC